MGRTQPTVILPPASFRKDARAKHAKATLNKTIPDLLKSNSRVRRGVDAAEVITNPPPSDQKSQPVHQSTIRIRLQTTDAITAAAQLSRESKAGDRNVAILNMASPLVPGGGFLNGATSQEEFLCLRTTVLPSLKDEFYRLPELGGVYTPDVLVFRDGAGADIPKRDRLWVDVISAGMLRFPETEVVEDEEQVAEIASDKDSEGEEVEEEAQRPTLQAVYAEQKDRDMAIAKMRAVMRILAAKGAQKVVLGAWGCGAYGNPVGEIARAWKKVLLEGDKKRKDKRNSNSQIASWGPIKVVVFAIKERRMATGFGKSFGEPLIIEEAETASNQTVEDDGALRANVELQSKIKELEEQIQHARSPQLRSGLEALLANLRKQLPKSEDTDDAQAAVGKDRLDHESLEGSD